MSLLSARFLNRKTTEPNHVGASTLPYSDTHSIRDVIDPLLAPSIVVEYKTLTSTHIAEGRVRLANTVARRDSVVVTVKNGIPQFYGTDFLVSEDSPNYVYWDGLELADRIEVGDIVMVQYESEGIPTGTPGVKDEPGGGGGFATPVKIYADHQVTGSETLLVDTVDDVVSVFLPEAAQAKDAVVIVKMVAGEHGVVITPFGTDSIDSVANDLVLDIEHASYTLLCDGEAWYIV